MTMTRDQLIARRDELKAQIDASTGWGAALGAMSEELKDVERALRAQGPASLDELRTENLPAAVFGGKHRFIAQSGKLYGEPAVFLEPLPDYLAKPPGTVEPLDPTQANRLAPGSVAIVLSNPGTVEVLRTSIAEALGEPPAAASGLTIASLQAAHVSRQAEWCPDQLPDLSFRGNELAGEAGETSEALILHAAEISKLAGRASNIVKKLERERHGWRGSRATKADLAAELADVIHCAVLCAITAGIDLDPEVTNKFNATSEKQGLSVFLPVSAPALSGDALDAARFRALMRCGRIKMQGSAGLEPDTGALKYPDRPGSVHFGAELWPQGDGEPDLSTKWGRNAIRALADDILALEAAHPSNIPNRDRYGHGY